MPQKSKYTPNPWTTQEETFLRENYLDFPVKTIARILGRSGCGVANKLKRENLVIPREIIEQRKKDSQFQPGQVSYTKGLKWQEFRSKEAQQKCLKTAFKKGNTPHNTKPVGTINERPDTSGTVYLYIKIADRHWELYQRHIWELHNGPIPTGHIIVFKDGDTFNCEPENLECITKEENMRRNSHINIHPELLPTIKLKNKILKKLKKLKQ